jgi:hypothetical protein
MRVVYKYVLEARAGIEQVLFTIPQGAAFCHLQAQKDQVALWYEVDTEQPLHIEGVVFRGFLTGEKIPNNGVYLHIGTALFNDGDFVFHVYEVHR